MYNWGKFFAGCRGGAHRDACRAECAQGRAILNGPAGAAPAPGSRETPLPVSGRGVLYPAAAAGLRRRKHHTGGMALISLRDILQYFAYNQAMAWCFVACCAGVLVWARKTGSPRLVKLSRTVVQPSALLLILLLNPVSAHVALRMFEVSQVQRFLWLVPITPVLAVCAVLLLGKLPGKALRAGAFAVLLCAVLAAGQGFPRLRTTWQGQRPNWYKVPQVVVELCDAITADGDGAKTAIFPMPLNLWVRQYCAQIELPFAWNSVEDGDTAEELYELYGAENAQEVDLAELARLAREGGYRYIVLAEENDAAGDLTQHGFVEVALVDADPADDTAPYFTVYILYRQG